MIRPMHVPVAVLFLLALAVFPGCERLEVTVVRVDRGPVESTVTSVEAGVVDPLQKASLASPVSGRIVRVNHAEGDRVEAGEVLVELENDLEKLRVEETGRELERLTKMKDDIATEEQIDRADFAHRRAKVDYERTFIRATFRGIVAEINARVGEMTFGSMALALGAGKGGQDSLVYLVDDTKLYVKAEIDESDVHRVKPGQEAKVTLSGMDRSALKAGVISISPAVSTQEGESRTAEVKVELLASCQPAPGNGGSGHRRAENLAPEQPSGSASPGGPPPDEPPLVLVGMSADLEILVGRVDEVLRVPTTAILERGEEKHVFVVRDGKLSKQPITLGIGNWDMTEVRSGLALGDLVVMPTDVKLLTDGRGVKARVDESPPGVR